MLDHDLIGSGGDVVFLHAALGDRRLWDYQFPWVADRRRALRCDLRGFGRSPLPGGRFSHAQDVADLLQATEIERPLIVAGSLGGRVALELAVAWPSLVGALLLVSPALTGYDWSPAVRSFGAAEDAALEGDDIDAAVELNLRMWFDGHNRPTSTVDPTRRAAVGEMQRLAFALQLAAGDDAVEVPLVTDLAARLSDIEVPTLVVVGAHDAPDFHTIGTLLTSQLPHARLMTLPDTAHVPNYESPDRFNPVLTDALTDLI